jgi:hypothetical protein
MADQEEAPSKDAKEKPAEAKGKDKKEAKEATPKEAREEKAAEEKEPAKMEVSYPERRLKSGEVYLKRKKGSPRFRKIVSTDHQAQLFMLVKGEWMQKSAMTGNKNSIRNLKWHLKNKWEKVEKSAVGK